MEQAAHPKLIRGLSLGQATAINMLDMVGIGPFVVISLVVSAMNGPQCILAWVFGALLALMDGTVWAELGAAMPEAGGSYVFLHKIFGEKKWGNLFSFLFIWQTVIQAPLVIASGSIGFTSYFRYLVPLNDLQQKMISGGLVILLAIVLYRKITSIGKISVFLWFIVIGTICWIIFGGLTHFNVANVFHYPPNSFKMDPVFFAGLGLASVKTVYSYLGYYNVCHLGAEIKNPGKNIPRSIFISIIGIAILYLLMQISVLAVIPWQKIVNLSVNNKADYVVSIFMEQLYGGLAARIVTILILCVAAASLMAAILGYSRIPYAAAKDGKFFAVFGRVHPTRHFPHYSHLILCGTAFIFSLLFRLKEVITAIIVMRILIQFVSQAIGLIYWRIKFKNEIRPYKMPLFPIPALLSIAGWLFIFFSTPWYYIAGAVGIIISGTLIFLVRSKINREWPYPATPGSI